MDSVPMWVQFGIAVVGAFLLWKLGGVKAQSGLLDLTNKELEVYKDKVVRLEADKETARKDIDELKATNAKHDATIEQQAKKLEEQTNYLRMDTVSPALTMILTKLAEGNMAAIKELQHQVEKEFAATREIITRELAAQKEQLNRIEKSANDWSSVAERRGTKGNQA